MAALAGAGLVCAMVPLAAATAPGADCFSAADNARLRFEAFQQAPPPRDGARYPHYPLSAAVSGQLGRLASAPKGIQTWYYHWANRAATPLVGAGGRQIVRKLNLEPSRTGNRRHRSAFSSIDRANACTMAQAASLLGQDARARRYARDAGVTLINERALPDEAPPSPADTCVLASGKLPPRASGIMLDYEVQDGRDPQTTETFLTAYAKLVHAAGKRVILLVNPLDSPGQQRFTGVTAENAHRIVARFDRTTLVLWSGNVQKSLPASYAAQMAIVKAGGPVDPKRLLIDFELAGTTLDDARFVRQAIIRDGLAGVLFWRNYASQGGACAAPVNQRIAAIAFGEAADEQR
ncbi:hypothetical protein [Novosphingobium sp. NDB2Meth1]|uniref:hypothetical protein n=1 Tax=Novosphingobium sp. NDB2Meth1 TaxID=1892847 RepID=UPI00093063B8|nr:hypothetical protein [Novosphingobium sp. NDB2Meth1]